MLLSRYFSSTGTIFAQVLVRVRTVDLAAVHMLVLFLAAELQVLEGTISSSGLQCIIWLDISLLPHPSVGGCIATSSKNATVETSGYN